MGLLLLIPGLVFLLNGVSWFDGENKVGLVLTVLGGVLILAQVLWTVYVASKVKRSFDRIGGGFFS
jgi:drug/metabolite transporter superfamily protein YnfA